MQPQEPRLAQGFHRVRRRQTLFVEFQGLWGRDRLSYVTGVLPNRAESCRRELFRHYSGFVGLNIDGTTTPPVLG